MHSRRQSRFKRLSYVLSLIFVVNSISIAKERNEYSYPIYTPALISQSVNQIRRSLSSRSRESLRFTEVLDLTIALTWHGEYDQALALSRYYIQKTNDDHETSSLFACIGTIKALQSHDMKRQAESLTWTQRHISARGRKEYLLANSHAYLKEALEAIVESCRLDPPAQQAKKLAALRLGLAHQVGDEMHIRHAKGHYEEIIPDATGEEVMEPITGIIIVAGIVAAGIGILYAADENARDSILDSLPALIGFSTALIVTIEAIATEAASMGK